VTIFYADTSALVKLVRDEPESGALRSYLSDADLVSCDLALTELPRAIKRAAALSPGLHPVAGLLSRADELLDALALMPLERDLLVAAGSLDEPGLRSLDAIHVAAASLASPLDGFVSYDERQAAAARLGGLRTFAPGT